MDSRKEGPLFAPRLVMRRVVRDVERPRRHVGDWNAALQPRRVCVGAQPGGLRGGRPHGDSNRIVPDMTPNKVSVTRSRRGWG